jgi:hypothetical protein
MVALRSMLLPRALGATTALLLFLAAPMSRASDPLLFSADRDDDANGVPDAGQLFVPPSLELFPIPQPWVNPAGSTFVQTGHNVRVHVDGRPFAPVAPDVLRLLS